MSCTRPGQTCTHRRQVGVDGLGRPRLRRPAICRVLARVLIDDAGCWIWTGSRQRFGYGQITVSHTEGRMLTHRLVYEGLAGPIPAGLELDHLCRVPACCNPAHLEPVTHAENVRRGEGLDNGGRYWRSRTKCSKGHPYTPKNTRWTPDGRRRCRTCVREWAAEDRARKAAAA